MTTINYGMPSSYGSDWNSLFQWQNAARRQLQNEQGRYRDQIAQRNNAQQVWQQLPGRMNSWVQQYAGQLPGTYQDAINGIGQMPSILGGLGDLSRFFNKNLPTTDWQGQAGNWMGLYNDNVADPIAACQRMREVLPTDEDDRARAQGWADFARDNQIPVDEYLQNNQELINQYKTHTRYDPYKDSQKAQDFFNRNAADVGGRMQDQFRNYGDYLQTSARDATRQLTQIMQDRLNGLQGGVDDAWNWYSSRVPQDTQDKLAGLQKQLADDKAQRLGQLSLETAEARRDATDQYQAQANAMGRKIDPSELAGLDTRYNHQFSRLRGDLEGKYADQTNSWLQTRAQDILGKDNFSQQMAGQLAGTLASGNNYQQALLAQALSGIQNTAQQSLGNLAQLGMGIGGRDLAGRNAFTQGLAQWATGEQGRQQDALRQMTAALTGNTQSAINQQHQAFGNLINALTASGQQQGNLRDQTAQGLLGSLLSQDQAGRQNLISMLSQIGMGQQAARDQAEIENTRSLTNAGMQDALSGRQMQRDLDALAAQDQAGILKLGLDRILGAEQAGAAARTDIGNQWLYQVPNEAGYEKRYQNLKNGMMDKIAQARNSQDIRQAYDDYLDDLQKDRRGSERQMNRSIRDAEREERQNELRQRRETRFNTLSGILRKQQGKKQPRPGRSGSGKNRTSGNTAVPELFQRPDGPQPPQLIQRPDGPGAYDPYGPLTSGNIQDWLNRPIDSATRNPGGPAGPTLADRVGPGVQLPPTLGELEALMRFRTNELPWNVHDYWN